MKKNALSFITLIIFLCGCETDIEKSTDFYPSGKLMSESEAKKGILHGDSKTYYETGELKSVAKYIDGEMVDTVFMYYPSGEIMLISPISKDSVQVESTSYYPDGKVSFKVGKVGNKKRGEAFEYSENEGNILTYLYYAANDEVTYRRDFDDSGGLIKEKGSLCPERLWINNSNFNVGDTLEVTIFTIAPPDCNLKVYSGEYDFVKKLLIDKEELHKISDNGFYKFTKILYEPGEFYWGVFTDLDCSTLLDESEQTEFVKITVSE